MSTSINLSIAEISAGLPSGHVISLYVAERTARTQHSVSNLVLNTHVQDTEWFEREIHRKMEFVLTEFIARQKAKSYGTSYGKCYTLEAVVLSTEELFALMDWASKNLNRAGA